MTNNCCLGGATTCFAAGGSERVTPRSRFVTLARERHQPCHVPAATRCRVGSLCACVTECERDLPISLTEHLLSTSSLNEEALIRTIMVGLKNSRPEAQLLACTPLTTLAHERNFHVVMHYTNTLLAAHPWPQSLAVQTSKVRCSKARRTLTAIRHA